MAREEVARINMITELRRKTKAPMALCKEVADTPGINLETAFEILEERLRAKGERRSVAETSTEVCSVSTYNHLGRIAVMLECSAQTSFVVGSTPFQEFVKDLAQHIAGFDNDGVEATIEALLTQPSIQDPSKTIYDRLTHLSGLVGEQIKIKRFQRWEAGIY